jgi:hypothetical protein
LVGLLNELLRSDELLQKAFDLLLGKHQHISDADKRLAITREKNGDSDLRTALRTFQDSRVPFIVRNEGDLAICAEEF